MTEIETMTDLLSGWREGSSFLPGAEHIVEMAGRLAAEGDSLDQILARIRREVNLIRRYELPLGQEPGPSFFNEPPADEVCQGL